MAVKKIPDHQYSDPYRLGKCLTCGKLKSSKPTKNCRNEYHGWQIIGERSIAAARKARS
jgi:hypothetical protein